MVRQGVGQSGAMLRAAVGEAKERLARTGGKISAGLRSFFGPTPATSQVVAPHYPSCRRIVRAGCGAVLPALCPKCGRALRP